jgi:hypothetical protein
VTDRWEGRASKALDENTTKNDATSTKLLRMQDSISEACPAAEANRFGAKMR